jgi:cell division protein FtsW
MLITRIDRGLLARWWFTVDRALLSLVLLLMALGVLASMAASPPVAERLGYDTFHFVSNQLLFMVLAVAVLFGASFLNITWVRRLSLLGYICGCLLMVAALNFGPEIKGAHRWINLGPFNLQPSELVKPTFTLMAAWLLAERVRRPDIPGNWFAWALYACFVTLLMLEPDFGQTLLITAVFGTMLIVSGISWKFTLCLIGGVMSGAVTAYHSLPHVASRIDRFLSPDKGDTFQVDTAIQAFHNGGIYGTGPGGGLAKQILPDAHTDFIFAVVGEEFGLIACAALVLLFGLVVMRVLARAIRETDPFIALALTGLVSIFGYQAAINMMVNVSLVPAKGMTLPFISYGGSSLISMAITMGLILALARKRPAAVLPQGLTAQGVRA